MSLLDDFARACGEHPWLERGAMASLELAVLAVALELMVRALRPRRPRLLAWLWLLVLAKPIVSLFLGAPLTLGVLHVPAQPVSAPSLPASVAAPAPIVHDSSFLAPGSAPGFAPGTTTTAAPTPLASARSLPIRSARDPILWLLFAWLLGVGVALLRQVRLERRLGRWVRAARPAPDTLQRGLESEARALALVPPRLRLSEAVRSPALVGLLRPTILVPDWLVRCADANALEWSLRHELQHLRARDTWALLVRRIALTLFYFHPCAYHAARRHAQALEEACDRDTLRSPADAQRYAEGLLAVATAMRGRRARLEPGMLGASGAGRMRERIAAVLDAERVQPAGRLAAGAVLFAAGVLFSTGAAVVPVQEHSHATFVFGPLELGEFEQLFARIPRVGSQWGREHTPEAYAELLDDPTNPFHRQEGDLLVLMFAGDAQSHLPAERESLLPLPWPVIERHLSQGKRVDVAGSAAGLRVRILGTPRRADLASFVAESLGAATSSTIEPATGGLPRGSRYTVRIDARAPRAAHVRLDLPATDGQVRLAMGPGAERFDDGYAHFVRNVVVKGTGVLSFQPERDGILLDAGDQACALDYTVELAHDSGRWPEGGPDEAPYCTGSDAFWTGRALFFAAPTDGVEVRFELSDGWSVATPWAQVEGDPTRYWVASKEELHESFLLAGTHRSASIVRGDTEVRLALGAGLEDSLEGLRRVVGDQLDAALSLFGRAPAARELLVANLGQPHAFDGGVFGNSISLLVDAPFDEANQARWAPFVAHELVHLWNGGLLYPADREGWFSEGFTEYLAHVVSARIGRIDRDAFLERVRRAAEAYLSVAGSSSIRDAGAPGPAIRALQYDGGMLVAFLLDIELRNEGDGTNGLDRFLQVVASRYGDSGEGYDLDGLVGILEEVSDADTAALLRQWVTSFEPLPLQAQLARAELGLRTTVEEVRVEKGHAIHDVLGIRSLTETPAGLRIRRTEGTPFEEGELLVQLNSEHVMTFEDIQHILSFAERGVPIRLDLARNDGSTHGITLTWQDKSPMRLEREVSASLTVDLQSLAKGSLRVLDGILMGR